MKQIDVTKKVMQHVAQYERTGISRWFAYFIISISSVFLASMVGFVFIINDLLSKHAFDLFELLSQDPEIIADFWREALLAFWDEIPQHILFIVVTLAICLLCIMVFTRSKRLQIRKKLQELDKYS